MSSMEASEGRRGTEGVSDGAREARGRSTEEEKGRRGRRTIDSWDDTRRIKPPAAAAAIFVASLRS